MSDEFLSANFTSMDSLTFLILIVIAGLLLLILPSAHSERVQRNTQRISDNLISKGASNIIISSIRLGGSRGHDVYDIEYTDRLGKRYRVRCKIQSGLLKDGDLFWSEPLEV